MNSFASKLIKILKRKTTVSSIVVLCTLPIIIFDFYALYRDESQNLHSECTKKLSVITEQLNAEIKQAGELLISHAIMVSDMPRVQTIFRQKNREALLAELKDVFATHQSLYGLTALEFQNMSGEKVECFLKVHRPSDYGDVIKNTSIITVNKTGKIQKGVELSRSGISIRGIAPIRDEQGHIGSIEFALKFKKIIETVKELHGVEIGIFGDKKILQGRMKREIFDKLEKVDGYVYLESTNKLKVISMATNAILAQSKTSNFSLSLRDNYGIATIPIYDHGNQNIGSILVVKSFEELRSAFNQKISWKIFYVILQIILTLSIAIIIINGFFLLPMKELIKRCEAIDVGKEASLREFTHDTHEIGALSELIAEIAILSKNTPATRDQENQEDHY